ncbi:MAG: hypothetical protein SFY92_03575 [Verrucomicrobiae bacterium]|nr:hypothetical protein [Verrucomicrobiae bacterium]
MSSPQNSRWPGRILGAAIVAFWAVMTLALVNREFFPDDSERFPIPLHVVLDKIFSAQEESELVIYFKRQEIGIFRLIPRVKPGSNTHPDARHSMLISGDVTVDLIHRKARARLSSRADFSPQSDLLSFSGEGKVDEMNFHAEGSAATGQISLSYRFDGGPEQTASVPFDLRQALRGSANPDYNHARQMLDQMRSQSMQVLSYSTQTTLNRENITAFVIESKAEGYKPTRIWVTRFGQIFRVETPFDFEMRPVTDPLVL